jgi:hypothetical protein
MSDPGFDYREAAKKDGYAPPPEPEPEPESTSRRLRIVDWDDFVRVEEPTAEAILGTRKQNVFPVGGLMLDYGDGGASKTSLLVDLAHHVAGGVDWLGLRVECRRRVLLLENEGSRGAFRVDGLVRRQAWKGPDLNGWLFALEEPWADFSFADPGLRRELAAWAREVEAEVVIGGPLVELGAAGTGSPGEVSEFVRLLASVRAEAERDLAFAIAHHENVMGRLSGAWARVPHTLVHLTERGPERIGVHWRKVRHSSELHGRRWKLRWAEGRTFVHDEEPDLTEEEAREAVVAVVGAEPGCSRATVEERAPERQKGLSRNRARQTLEKLLKEEVVVDRGSGKTGTPAVLYLADEDGQLPLDDLAGGTSPGGGEVGGEVTSHPAGPRGSPRPRDHLATSPPLKWRGGPGEVVAGPSSRDRRGGLCLSCELPLVQDHPGQPYCRCSDEDRWHRMADDEPEEER